jgi:hypothetical protein
MGIHRYGDAPRPRFPLRPVRGIHVALALLLGSSMLLGTTPVQASFPAFTWSSIGSTPPTTPSGSAAEIPAIKAMRMEDSQSIKVDGKLDDAAWKDAEPGGGFRAWSPDRGGPPYGETVFKFAYDREAVFFGIACKESDPAKVTKKLARRDNDPASDNVAIYVDPYHDHSTGYIFAVNPLGVQKDSAMFNDGDEDGDWDAVWQASTYQDADGWYAEVRIPFSSIRYRTEGDTWGLEVSRDVYYQGRTDGWIVWDRDLTGFVSRFGHLTGFENIPPPRQLEFLPYAVYRATDPATPGPEEVEQFQNMGLDMKYGATSALVLNATFQPDFGQVEADPATLNLSPYETFYQEKRPFFIEGSRYLRSPGFNVFYSRRIGTGDQNSRIRGAGKLTGKTQNGVSIGALAAMTDITQEGQTHNFMKTGLLPSNYFVGRIGKESGTGNQRINIMQTAVVRPGARDQYGDYGSREAYTTAGDFNLKFKDRRYSVTGVVVGSIIASEPAPGAASDTGTKMHGTGGTLTLSRNSATWSGSVNGGWATDRLDLNDIGYLRNPDYATANLFVQYRREPKGEDRKVNTLQINHNTNLGWTYAGRTGYDIHTGEPAWSYGRGHGTISSSNINFYTQLRNFWALNGSLTYQYEGTQRYDTRNTVVLQSGRRGRIPGGGPLLGEPRTLTGSLGVDSDYRKDLVYYGGAYYSEDAAANTCYSFNTGAEWNQTRAIRHSLGVHYEWRTDDTQHIENFENVNGGGIGGVDYVYGKLLQKTLDTTIRSNILFTRNHSLEIYAQPYLTVGSYSRPRTMVAPDTYELAPYSAEGFNLRDSDFRYASVNLNAVYRWEYRPGSTFYFVWTHSREAYEERGFAADPSGFDNGMGTGSFFKNEPENVLLVKMSYWFPV